jgi:hypothetical protein
VIKYVFVFPRSCRPISNTLNQPLLVFELGCVRYGFVLDYLYAWIRIRLRHPRSDVVAKYCVENFQVHSLLVTSYRMPGRRLPL